MTSQTQLLTQPKTNPNLWPQCKLGSLLMTEDQLIDTDLIDQVLDHIPRFAWTVVRDAIITNLVDSMPSWVVEQLTGDPENFDRADEILQDYYNLDERKFNLIEDAFRILGDENTMYLLDGLQLDKLAPPTDNTPCSIDPQ